MDPSNGPIHAEESDPSVAFNLRVNRFFSTPTDNTALLRTKPWESNWLCNNAATPALSIPNPYPISAPAQPYSSNIKENIPAGHPGQSPNSHLTDTFKRLDSSMLAKRLGSVYGSTFTAAESLTAATQAGQTPKRQQ